MKDGLPDYCGDFNSKTTYSDFNGPCLDRLCTAYALTFNELVAVWHRAIRESVGEDAAREVEKKVWMMQIKRDQRWLKDALKIEGDDIVSFAKMLQFDIGFPLYMYENNIYEFKSPKHLILTISRCTGLEYYERHRPHLIEWLCQDVEKTAFTNYGREFNGNMKVTALKLPPRENDSDIACKWEFKIE